MAWAGQGTDPFNNLQGTLFDFYNDGDEGSRTAFDTYLNSLGLTQNAKRYAKGLFGDVNRGYGAYSLGQADPTSTHFTDYLKNGGASGFIDQYNSLSAGARGFNVGRFNSGRKMF